MLHTKQRDVSATKDKVPGRWYQRSWNKSIGRNLKVCLFPSPCCGSIQPTSVHQRKKKQIPKMTMSLVMAVLRLGSGSFKHSAIAWSLHPFWHWGFIAMSRSPAEENRKCSANTVMSWNNIGVFCKHAAGMLPASRHSCKGDCPILLEDLPRKKQGVLFLCVVFLKPLTSNNFKTNQINNVGRNKWSPSLDI